MNEHRGIWRGKGVNNWHYGDLIRAGSEGNHSPIIIENGERFDVLSETLGECTGLTDKNGELIFEGDIIDLREVFDCESAEGLYEVVWDDAYASFYLEGISDVYAGDIEYGAAYGKVVGNIHDNPQLMQEGATDDASPVKHGYWDDSFDGITPVCSVCGMTHHEYVRCPDYCPHCNPKWTGKERRNDQEKTRRGYL